MILDKEKFEEVKFDPVYDMKAYRGGRGIVLFILDLALDGGG